MSNDNDNTNPPAPAEIAPEWREFWNTDDVIQSGDQYLFKGAGDGRWWPVLPAHIGSKARDYHWLSFRRRNTPAPAEIAPEWREFWNTEEIVQAGDQYDLNGDPSGQWKQVTGVSIGSKACQCHWLRFRRRIAPAPAAAPVIAEPGEVHQKPPLGVIPYNLWKEYRVADLHRAICDYANAGIDSPCIKDWESEVMFLSNGPVGLELLRASYHEAKAEADRLRAELAAHREMESNFIELGIAARGLVEKLEKINGDDSYYWAFRVAESHGFPYTGPNYTIELARLKSLLPQYSSVPEMVAAMQKDASLSEENDRLRAELATLRAERDREIAVTVAFEAEAAKLRIARVEAERDEARKALETIIASIRQSYLPATFPVPQIYPNHPTVPHTGDPLAPQPTYPAWPTAPAPYCPPAFPNYPVVTYTGDPLPPMPETVCGAGQNTNQKA